VREPQNSIPAASPVGDWHKSLAQHSKRLLIQLRLSAGFSIF
jgi:hypothetical protein